MVRDSGQQRLATRRRSSSRWATAGRRRSTARDYGIPIGLSSDVATTASSDQFTQMHAIFASERARRYEIAWDENLEWNQPESKLITSRQVLAMGDARRREGRRHRRPDRLDHARQEGRPRDHRRPAPSTSRRSSTRSAAVVCAADISNVDTVIVDGKILKRDGKLARRPRRARASASRRRATTSSASSASPSRAGCRRPSPRSHVITAGRPGCRPAGSARPSAARVGVAPNAGPARRPRRALRQMPRSRRVSSRGRATRRRWAVGRSPGVPSAASSLRHGPAPAPPTASRPPAAGSRTSSRRRARTRP